MRKVQTAYSAKAFIMKHRPHRLRYTFWLDHNKPDEEAIADQIELLKNDRGFVSAVREGIRLICDLRAGRVDVLLELFPFVQDVLCARSGGGDVDDIRRQIEDVQRLLMSQNNGAIMAPVAPTAGPKPLAVPPIAAPVDDDDMPALVLKKAASDGKSAENFLKSAFNLVQ